MPVAVKYATFRVTFDDVVTVSSFSDFLTGRNWRGFSVLEVGEAPSSILHAHGIVFNAASRAVRDAIRYWLRGLGRQGNEFFAVSEARDNTAACQYCSKSVAVEPESGNWDEVDTDDIDCIIWCNGIEPRDIVEFCRRYHEREEQLASTVTDVGIVGRGPGRPPSQRSAGNTAVDRLLVVCRRDGITDMHGIVRTQMEICVSEHKPMNMFFVQSVCWTVYMILNGNTGVEDAVSAVVRRMGYGG